MGSPRAIPPSLRSVCGVWRGAWEQWARGGTGSQRNAPASLVGKGARLFCKCCLWQHSLCLTVLLLPLIVFQHSFNGHHIPLRLWMQRCHFGGFSEVAAAARPYHWVAVHFQVSLAHISQKVLRTPWGLQLRWPPKKVQVSMAIHHQA